MSTIIAQIISLILTLLSKEQGKKLIDGLLDTVEDWATNTENKIDDAIILPLCKKAREILDVPDND